MSDIFLVLVFALLVVPGDFENYDVFIIPILKANRRKSVEVYLLPRNLMLLKHHLRHHQFNIEDFGEPNEPPNGDNFENRSVRARGKIPPSKLLRASSDGTQNEYNNEDMEDRIVDGFEVDINMYPYNVAYGSNCGGAIIGSKWVLTAAHCGIIYIRTGSKYRDRGKISIVRNSHFHPMWEITKKEHSYDYDYQLLELQKELKFDENTQPVKLGRLEDMAVGKLVTVTGWGHTQEGGELSNVLRAINVPIISKAVCQQVDFPYFRGGLTARMFCAGYSEGKMDACQGDSGGPAVSNDRLLGMVSFGYGCATPGSYGVYSKVAEAQDWIQSVTNLKLD